MKLLPYSRVLTQADCWRILGQQTFKDAVKAGWLKPCASKSLPNGPRQRYALADIQAVKERILSGDYPDGDRQAQKEAAS